MSGTKRVCALLLAAVLLLTALPAAVFAQEGGAAQMTYNCGNQEITLGESGTAADGYFEEDGSYTITLEQDAFFPYEVQFQYDGQTMVKTFDTPDSVLTVGGHAFRVESEYSDTGISQIGIYIGGRYVAARPEPKEFTPSPGPGARSLLPLQRRSVNLDLTSFRYEDLEQVEVSAILGAMDDGQQGEIAAAKKVLWNFGQDDRETFRPISSGPVNLQESYYTHSFTMLVGSGSQLDKDTLRYSVYVNTRAQPCPAVSVYAQEGSIRTHCPGLYPEAGILRDWESSRYASSYNVSDVWAGGKDFYFGIDTSDVTSDSPGYSFALYRGSFNSEEEALADPAADITKEALNQEMENAGAGYRFPKEDFSRGGNAWFTLVSKRGSRVIACHRISVFLPSDEEGEPYIRFAGLYARESGKPVKVSGGSRAYTGQPEEIVTTLYGGYTADRDYHVVFDCYIDKNGIGETDNSLVSKAVLGHYDTLEAAASQPDIKEQLLGEGYLANFGQGVGFTFFIRDQAYSCTLSAQENPGSGDTYLDISGAEGIEEDRIYKVASKDDSGAVQFGYQILLVDDASASLSALKPVFSTHEGIEAYVAGEKQVSGESVQDFSGGPVQYSARSSNGRTVKNYWVTFAKMESDAKLFVVIDGEKPGEREIFFDNFAGEKHDIFIANVGKTALTGLKAELQNAKNVKLDDYWQLGGEGNDTLDGFAQPSWNWYNEADGIAKLRLIPDGEGEVSGTLVISSDNGGSYSIALKGRAGNPRIVTEQLNDAVKYVPYSFLIQSDNKYEWNDVHFQLGKGKLPEGMTLRPSGEIYGVPLETGEFTFTVYADYSYLYFEPSQAEFTLKVKQNTDANVAGEVDSGYRILDGVSRILYETSDCLFRSEGAYSEFIDFWLDGNRLQPDVDYEAKEGSTAITIFAKTFQKYGVGDHTIAAEFRVDGEGTKALKRTAQNYTLDLDSGSKNPGSSGGADGSSGSGGSGSSAGTDTSSRPDTDGGILAATRRAVQRLQQDVEQLFVKLRGKNFVPLKELQTIAREAASIKKSPWLNVDTLIPDGRAVDVRVGLDPSLAKEGKYMAASTYSRRAGKIRALFEKYFSNPIVLVVSLSQKEDFGQAAVICARLPEGIRTDTLVFYAYDQKTNTYRRIVQPNAWLDANQYLHFDCPYGGDIVISVGALQKAS